MKKRHNPLLLIILIFRLIFILVFTPLFLPSMMVMIIFGTNVTHKMAIFWSKILLPVLGIRIKKFGKFDKNNGPVLYICNHLSFIDIPVLMFTLKPQFRFIADEFLYEVPVLGRIMKLCGYIKVSQGKPKSVIRTLNKAIEEIKNGTSILLFHEGGINRTDNKSVLKSVENGLFRIAEKSKCKIQPITASGTDYAFKNFTNLYSNISIWFNHQIIDQEYVNKTDKSEIKEMLIKINKTAYDKMIES